MKYFKNILFIIVVMLCFTNTQCDTDDDVNIEEQDCDEVVLIDEAYYNNLESVYFTFVSIEINEDCLAVSLSASGCDGNSWEFKLVDSGAVAESSPEQRYLKLELINDEDCLAVISGNVTFNLNPIRVEGSNHILLHIEDYPDPITYSY